MPDHLAGTAEHHRIAGRQTNDTLAGFSELGHHVTDIRLPVAGLPADPHALRLTPSEFQNLRRNQGIEQDDIGGLQGAHGLEGQKLGVARTGADQRDRTEGGGFREPFGISKKHPAYALLRRIRCRKGKVGKAFPEGPTLLAGFELSVNGIAQGLRQYRPALQATRQQRLDLAADGLCEDRGGTIRRNRDDDGRAVDDGAELELAEFRLVDDVDRHARRAGGIDKRPRIRFILTVGNSKRGAAEITRRPQAPMRCKFRGRVIRCAGEQHLERLVERFRIDIDMRTTGGEQFRLPGCRIRAAGDDDALSFQRPEDREFGEQLHARQRIIPLRQQDIHR